jgi:glycosyltransferase involved in cell wall biosynthesis
MFIGLFCHYRSDAVTQRGDSMKARLKVVYVTEDMPVGGQEKVIATLSCGLDPERFAIEVWCLVRGGALADQLRQAGISVRILGLASYHHPVNIVRMAAHLRRAGADIIHTHGSYAWTFGRLAAILAGKVTVVAHVHTNHTYERRRHVWIERVLSCGTQKIVCVSQAVRDHLVARTGIPAAKTCVIHNGVPPCAPPSSPRQTSVGPADCLIVSIGSLVENKGHRYLIDAFQQAISICSALRLLIIGDGPLRAELEHRIAKAGLSGRVELTGCVANVHPILDRADMVVLPTIHREGLGLVLMEAQQHALPVIATWIGGIPEVVQNGQSGLLVPPGDHAALGNAIVKLAGDPSLRVKLGAAGRATYEARFRAERMVAQVESLYATICGVQRVAA